MTWSVNPTITVNGIAYTNLTFNQVSIDYGRSKIFDTPRAGFARVEIANLTDAVFPFKINDSMVITLKNGSNIDTTVFTGIVTDVRGSFRTSDTSSGFGVITLTAVAPMAEMSRKIVGQIDYPSETDAARIQRILTEAGVTIDTIDPGIYTLAARAASITDAFTLANDYAMSVLGAIYETTDGKVGFANESRRRNEAVTNGFLSIPNSYILISSIASNENIADVMNIAKVNYSGGVATDQDVTSQSTYGIIGANFSTQLVNLADAEAIAATYINLRSVPRKSLSNFSIRLLDPTITTSLLDDLLDVYFGMPIAVPGLPNAIVSTDYEGYVEGWNLTFSPAQATLTLKTSQEAYSYRDMRWQDVNPTAKWSDINPTATTSTKTNLVPNPSFEPTDYGILGYFPVDYTRRQRITFPDEAAFDITGDIDIRVKVAMDDWTPASQSGFIFRDTSSNRTWQFTILSSGNLYFQWWENQTTTRTSSANAATGITDGSTSWIRVTLDVDNGAGGRTIAFYKSSDGSNWTQIGTSVTSVGTTSINATAAQIDLGHNSWSGIAFNGKIYAAQVRNGIDGTVVLYTDIAADWNPSDGFTYTAYSGQTGTVINFTSIQWTANTGTSFALSTAKSYSGRGSILNTVTTAGTSRGVFTANGYRIPVSVGTTYVASAYILDINTSSKFRIEIQWFTAITGGTLISTSAGTATTISSTNWTRLSVSGAAPATATHARVFIYNTDSAALNTQFYVDAVQFEAASSASTYFDGSYSDIPYKEYPVLAWSGTAQESSSTAVAYWGTKPTTLWNNVDDAGIP